MFHRSKLGHWLGAGIGVAFIVVPAVHARADDRAPTLGTAYVHRADSQSVSASAASTLIDQRIERDLGDQCVYRAHVQGAVRDGRSARGARAYSPELRVTASVRCPSGESVIQPRVVEGTNGSAAELESAVERAASVVVFRERSNTAQTCTVAPDLALSGSRLSVRGVEQQCSLPVGGGPSAGGAVQVRERFARDLQNECEYRATVRGRVQTAGTNGQYRADVSVRPEVHCPGVSAALPPARRVQIGPASREAVERALGERAAVRMTHGAGVCTYTPAFRVGQDGLSGRDVNFSCRAADGEPVVTGGVLVDRSEPQPAAAQIEQE